MRKKSARGPDCDMVRPKSSCLAEVVVLAEVRGRYAVLQLVFVDGGLTIHNGNIAFVFQPPVTLRLGSRHAQTSLITSSIGLLIICRGRSKVVRVVRI